MESRTRCQGRLRVVLLAAQLALFVSAENCLLAAEDEEIKIKDDNDNPRLPSGSQAIITSYKFGCCGNITAWQTYVQPGGGVHQGVYDITFQVWRPSPTVQENGCYSRVGENRFTSISLYSEGLVSETPEPTNILTVQPGDVVGYFTFSRRGMGDGIQLDDDDKTETVWYHTNTDSDHLIAGVSNCEFPVGRESGRTLTSFTDAAPVLSVDVSSFSCSPTPTMPPTLPSLLTPSTMPQQSTKATPPSTGSMNMLQQSSSTVTTAAVGNGDGVGVAVVAGVVVLVMLVVSALVALVVVLVLWRRKKKVKQEVSGKDLSNPNYSSFSLSSLLKQRINKKKKSSPIKTLDEPPSIPLHCGDKGTNMYASPIIKDPTDYTYATASHTPLSGSSSNTYAYVPFPPGSSEPRGSAEVTLGSDEDILYHAVGPNVRRCAADTSSYGSTPPPSYHPPVPTGSGVGQEGFSHMLEGALEDPSLQYQEPALVKFYQQDSAKKKGMFESTGYYVPTEEQRKVFGSNYEQQYETTSVAYNKLNFFMEDQIYWAPASTASGLYSQLASKRYREIQRDQIRIMRTIGSGQFGEVCKALWTVGGHTLELAVKTLKPGASEVDKVKFLQEAAINGQFCHSNVIKMHGIVTLGEPVLICLEILANGDLRSYLQGLKLSGSKHIDFMEAQIMFLMFAKNIAAGMEYLSKKSFVHRDLAARNILLDKSLTCKVADFGMARDLMDDTYYTSSGGKIPLKWTAPETAAREYSGLHTGTNTIAGVVIVTLATMLALLYKKYSADSDVWSYGMVLFEIWSIAKKPFSTVSNSQLIRLIQKGFCQAPPPGCPRAVYEVMVDCWNPDHQSRPSFSKICSSYLQQSSARILYWAPEDETLSPAVGVCGAPLEEASKLHLDLQEKYKNSEKIF